MTAKGYTFCYYVSGHGFGHATRVNQIITELLQSKTSSLSTEVSNGPLMPGNKDPKAAGTKTTTITTTITSTVSRHTIYIVSDAPQFIFQDVIALGAIYRNAKVDAGVVQPLAYSVDRKKTIEGVKAFLARRDDMIRHEVSWLEQVGANCVLADAPFLPCAAASAYGIPACLITNFTFDEVYRFLREGDPMDKDVMACADAALEDYKKASLLLRLPGSIDIPAFADEIKVLESRVVVPKTTREPLDEKQEEPDSTLFKNSPGQNGTISINGAHGQPQRSQKKPTLSVNTAIFTHSSTDILKRRAIDVPLVVRKHINTREDVLRSLGVDEVTIRTKKMVLVSFGGQRLKQGWGNPLPEGWIGVICGLPVSHELPAGFYRSPHGVYVPDLTHAADIVIGKLGYGTCSECIAHDTPLIYVSRPQFIEEHGLIKLMINYGLPVEMTAEEFETGLWQRSILEADRLAQEEKQRRRLYLETHLEEGMDTLTCMERTDTCPPRRRRSLNTFSNVIHRRPSKAKSLAESVNMGEMARGGPIFPVDEDDPPLLSPARARRRSDSITSLSSATFRSRFASGGSSFGGSSSSISSAGGVSYMGATCGGSSGGLWSSPSSTTPASATDMEIAEEEREEGDEGRVWFERRISHDGGKVCAQLVEEYMRIWDESRQGARALEE